MRRVSFAVALVGIWIAGAGSARADAEVSAEESAEAEGPVLSVGAEAAAASRYAFRGFALTTAPVLTPSAWASFADFTLTSFLVLQTSEVDGDVVRELDVDLAYSKSFGIFTIEPGLASYLTPTGGSTAEALVTLSVDGDVFGVHTSHAVDLLAAPGAYYAELGVSAGGDVVERLSVSASLDAGAGTARFHDYNAGVAVAGITVVRASTEVVWQLSDVVYLSARLELDSLVAGSVRRAVDEPVLLHGGIAAGFEL
jgi:hypothetical protein